MCQSWRGATRVSFERTCCRQHGWLAFPAATTLNPPSHSCLLRPHFTDWAQQGDGARSLLRDADFGLRSPSLPNGNILRTTGTSERNSYPICLPPFLSQESNMHCREDSPHLFLFYSLVITLYEHFSSIHFSHVSSWFGSCFLEDVYWNKE